MIYQQAIIKSQKIASMGSVSLNSEDINPRHGVKFNIHNDKYF